MSLSETTLTDLLNNADEFSILKLSLVAGKCICEIADDLRSDISDPSKLQYPKGNPPGIPQFLRNCRAVRARRPVITWRTAVRGVGRSAESFYFQRQQALRSYASGWRGVHARLAMRIHNLLLAAREVGLVFHGVDASFD